MQWLLLTTQKRVLFFNAKDICGQREVLSVYAKSSVFVYQVQKDDTIQDLSEVPKYRWLIRNVIYNELSAS